MVGINFKPDVLTRFESETAFFVPRPFQESNLVPEAPFTPVVRAVEEKRDILMSIVQGAGLQLPTTALAELVETPHTEMPVIPETILAARHRYSLRQVGCSLAAVLQQYRACAVFGDGLSQVLLRRVFGAALWLHNDAAAALSLVRRAVSVLYLYAGIPREVLVRCICTFVALSCYAFIFVAVIVTCLAFAALTNSCIVLFVCCGCGELCAAVVGG